MDQGLTDRNKFYDIQILTWKLQNDQLATENETDKLKHVSLRVISIYRKDRISLNFRGLRDLTKRSQQKL